MEIKNIVEIAKAGLVQLTGFSSPAAIGINKEADIWHNTVEITEKSSAAPNLDLLGIYDVRVDASGNLLGYEKIGMRKRGDVQKG
ncbi:MAG: gas vesicle protein [Bacteroidetes bacterium]|nr:gas vesicle protein [Patescibacteria group bacterium]MBU1679315.1 gas vesicle protein [Bacteroidota bacterium]MBU2506547.1 gas vesicle protein [Bacteroidota bacterium]